jgi:hypothetical protein
VTAETKDMITWNETLRMRRRALGPMYSRYLLRAALMWGAVPGGLAFMYILSRRLAALPGLPLWHGVVVVLVYSLFMVVVRVCGELVPRRVVVRGDGVYLNHLTKRSGQYKTVDIVRLDSRFAQISFRLRDRKATWVVGANTEQGQEMQRFIDRPMQLMALLK